MPRYHARVTTTDGMRVADARRAAGLTQRALASRSGVAQPHIARIESGQVTPTAATVEKLLRAARPPAREVLAAHRDEIVAAIRRRGGTGEVRVFGSVARGEDGPDSDIDLLVVFGPGTDLFDIVDLERDLAVLLGRPVDVMPSTSGGRVAERARREAVSW